MVLTPGKGQAEKFATGEFPKEQHVQRYLGLPLPEGHVHQEFPDTVEAIGSYVDDIAFFSHLLCKDLMKHGEKVRTALHSKPSKRVPRVTEVDFSGPLNSGLMPDEAAYSDWANAFVEREER